MCNGTQAPNARDAYRIVTQLPDGRYAAAQWYETCLDCGCRMAHGKLAQSNAGGFTCEQCAAVRRENRAMTERVNRFYHAHVSGEVSALSGETSPDDTSPAAWLMRAAEREMALLPSVRAALNTA